VQQVEVQPAADAPGVEDLRLQHVVGHGEVPRWDGWWLANPPAP
jgi:hypothetical protein